MLDIGKYSDYWFENASLDELKIERDIVQWLGLNKPNNNDDFREECRKVLYKFDDLIRKQQYNTNDVWNPPAKSEHGWYLKSDGED